MYSDILRNPHFNNLAAIIRQPFLSKQWRREHSAVPFWQILDGLNKAKEAQAKEFVIVFCDLLSKLAAADFSLAYTIDDLAWFINAMDGEHALTVASLLLAYASASEV